MSDSQKCEFVIHEKGGLSVIPSDCDEKKRPDSKFCIFHDENYRRHDYPGFEAEANNRFKEKVNELSDGQSLECIGYMFPNICINQHFNGPVYFRNCRFFGFADFYGAIFEKSADFSSTLFEQLANFPGPTGDPDRSKFKGKASFDETWFNGEANFMLAKFEGETSFIGAKFKSRANFVDTKFSGDAIFSRANFQEANFSGTQFQRKAIFNFSIFSEPTFFGDGTTIDGKIVWFIFNDKAYFNKVIFEGNEKICFETERLSKVSFTGTDITRISFSGNTRWSDEEKFKILEEREIDEYFERRKKYSKINWEDITRNGSRDNFRFKAFLKDIRINLNDKARLIKKGEKRISTKASSKDRPTYSVSANKEIPIDFFELAIKENSEEAYLYADDLTYRFSVKKQGDNFMLSPFEELNLHDVRAIYRNLRENYEYRLNYDDAGKFFIREMELKRKYKEIQLKDGNVTIEKNSWIWRQFSLTGIYYHLSRYGEDLVRPALTGLAIVVMSTFFWLVQINPSAEPSFTNTVGLANVTNNSVLQKSLERSISDLLPLLSSPPDIKIGLIDFIIKIIGGAVTFGLLAIALRRKFERKYTR